MGDTKTQFMTDWRANEITNEWHTGPVFRRRALVTFGNSDPDHDANDVIEVMPLPTNAMIDKIIFRIPALTSGAADLGLYRYDAYGNRSVVDADLFASAQALGSALVDLNVLYESTVFPITSHAIPLWDAVSGITEDPGGDYVLAFTITTALGGAGTGLVMVDYTI